MFEAFVLICMVHQPYQCVVMQDIWGPYQTKVECTARITKMKEDIMSVAIVTYLMPKDSICKEKEST